MIVLDTNVLSEVMKPAPPAEVPPYALIASRRRRAGRPISHFDAQIAAIALSSGAAIATRNVADLEGCGVALVDPWKP